MSFDDYVDLQGKLGSWAGAFEVEVLSSALKRRFWICAGDHAYLYNEEGEGPPVVLQDGQDHYLYLYVEGVDEHVLGKRRKRLMKDASQTFRGGVPSLRLSDFATQVGNSQKLRSAPSCKSLCSCRLTDFASIKSARPGHPIDAAAQPISREDTRLEM